MKILVVIALLLAHHATADAKCRHKGKVIFRETKGPLKDAPVSTDEVSRSKLTIFDSGAWDRDGERGCLSAKHLKAVKAALAKAKFALEQGYATCKALSTTEIVYSSPKRKKKVTTAEPCGPPVDEWTANLVVCAEHAGTEPQSLGEVLMLCRGVDPLM